MDWLCKRNQGVIIIILFLNTVFISNLHANSFKINEIEVSQDFNLDFNKKKVFDEAFKAAYVQLISTIITSKDKKKIEKINLSTIKSLIDSFNVSDEKFIEDRYYVTIIGNKFMLARNLRKIIKLAENRTKKNKKISIQLALNYGSKNEIINSLRIINKKKQKITKKNFEKNLYTSGLPDPDILIRTGGQRRLSNFLLWQTAYTEIFFVNKMWPDFSIDDFQKILNKFKEIKRNFGKI